MTPLGIDAPPQVKRVVAIQPRTELGEVERNLARIEDLVRAACREHDPDMVFLPEAMTSPNAYHPKMRAVARPIDGAPFQLLRSLAREYGCFVGGGWIAIRGRDTRGTYCLAEPGGACSFHDKDMPSFWENNYYAPPKPHDDGIAETSAGPIGLANGFEWGRTRTVLRLRGRVRLMAGGMHFPSFPSWALTRRWFIARDHELLSQYARETPPRVARMLGVPAVHPSHVGEFTMATPLVPGLAWPTTMVGETQICDRDGVTLGRLGYEDGEGYVCADVTLQAPEPRDPVPDTFWNATFPWSVHPVWYLGNAHGRVKYEAMKLLGRHSWKPGIDFPNHLPAEQAPPIPEPALADLQPMEEA